MGRTRPIWRAVAGGHLAIGHRPGRRRREVLAEDGCTLVVSLLSHKESSASEGPRRLRLPLASADPPGEERIPEIRACFERMHAALQGGGRLYVHCSAGLHRTGMITYAFLRTLGHSPPDALALLAELRPLTADEVGAHRLQWGEQLIAHIAGADEPRT